uniref:Uncharacterized protein n=1 Tax=Lepeophtheirus salmonis TaxID=72036 RepID=A0A0K2VB50_LEPSM
MMNRTGHALSGMCASFGGSILRSLSRCPFPPRSVIVTYDLVNHCPILLLKNTSIPPDILL